MLLESALEQLLCLNVSNCTYRRRTNRPIQKPQVHVLYLGESASVSEIMKSTFKQDVIIRFTSVRQYRCTSDKRQS